MGKPEPEQIYELGWDDKLDFGKHKGLTVQEVFDNNPGWISWSVAEQILFYNKEVIQQLAAWEFNSTEMPDSFDVWEDDLNNRY